MLTIYCTTKLKDFFKPVISEEIPLSVGDKWNANLFYLSGRKCVVFLNKETVYVVVLFDILKKDLKNIKTLFTEAFIRQLYSDGILEKEQELLVRNQIGEIYLRPTDNDRSALGSLNDVIIRMTYRNNPEKDIIEQVKKYVGRYLNATPMGSINFSYPKERMLQKIKNNH